MNETAGISKLNPMTKTLRASLASVAEILRRTLNNVAAILLSELDLSAFQKIGAEPLIEVRESRSRTL